MTPNECKPSGLLHSADELRQLIRENPTLPLLVFAGENANTGDYSYMSCSYIKAYRGEFLDCAQSVNDERLTPTADVVPVVRCKDCKYYVYQYCTRDIKCRTNMFYMCADDFCSYGERKDEE